MTAYQSLGVTFAWNGNTVGELTSISGMKKTTAFTDVTTHEDTDAFTKELPTLITAGDITLEGWFDPADTDGQIALSTDQDSRTLRTVTITFPSNTGTVFTFDGYVADTEFSPNAIDGVIIFTAVIKPFGAPSSFAVATSTGLTTPYFVISESAVITPSAAGDVYTYVGTVLTGISSVTVTPTATAGVITVEGNIVATGVESSAITLGAAGSVTEITIVVTETDKAPKTYTIWLSRAAS